MTTQTVKAFKSLYGAPPEVLVTAPGRVNLMGDHTDYNDGLVLPMAIDRAVVVAARRCDQPRLNVHSAACDETMSIPLLPPHSSCAEPRAECNPDSSGARANSHTQTRAGSLQERYAPGEAVSGGEVEPVAGWARYVYGVAAMLGRQRFELCGADLWIGGDLAPGAGLASSAALEVGVAKALLSLMGHDLSPVALATLCRAAEKEFAGSPCGIMDQLCCTSARAGHALLLDCRTMITEHVSLSLENAEFVVLDSGARHEIAGGEYAKRRRECAAALAAIHDVNPGVRSLRNVSAADLPHLATSLDETLTRRLYHVVTENARVLEAADALRKGELERLGRLMTDSHQSLRDDFEVSCEELDTLVEIAQSTDGVFGARMTGGGFGGCAVALARSDAVNALEAEIRENYNGRFESNTQVFAVRSAGAVEAHSLSE